ncbi:MAG TPA: hypothetical protein O0X32_01635, partial [Methanocorpusculum sp.]|nr:hypothetical protein [Methanocorpusculum sp.]
MAEPKREQVLSEISLILRTAGYDCEAEDSIFNLSGVKGNQCLIVLCSEDLNLLQKFDMTSYTIMLRGTKILCDKLIFTDNSYFKPKESTLWTKDILLQNIAAAAAARIYDLPYSFERGSPMEHSTSVTPDLLPLGYNLMLPVRISDKDALRVSHQIGSVTLRMIPYWRYHYTSNGDATYKGKTVNFDDEGYGWINAINGLDGEFEKNVMPISSEMPADAKIINAIITKEEVQS